MATLIDALLAVEEILRKARIPYALCGGLAANLYREEVRATSDVDFATVMGPAQVVEVVGTFERAGWSSAAYWQRGEQLKLSRDDMPRVDCIIATTDYERAAIGRAAAARIEGREVRVLTPEDLIVFKLMAGRARDYEAVAAIINARRRRLDVGYIQGWLEQFDIVGAWERAIEEARREREQDRSG